jgi:hypothetical protein
MRFFLLILQFYDIIGNNLQLGGSAWVVAIVSASKEIF